MTGSRTRRYTQRVPRRRGFLTYLLLGAMIVVGILVFALQNYARQQNRFAHRIAYGQACESAARSGLTVLSTRFRETFHRTGKLMPLLAALGNTRLGFFVASRPEQVTQRFAALGSDSHSIFRALLGPDYRYPLDQMLERWPGMQVELTIDVKGSPLYENAGVTDPVEKTVDMTLTARATWMDVTRRVSTGWQIKVVNPTAPLTSKFTLFTPEAAASWNTLVNDGDGKLLAGSTELAVLYNHPFEDIAAGLDDNALIARKADASTVRAAMGDRGHVYLGSRMPISLNLTAGLDQPGQLFHLYSEDKIFQGRLWTTLYTPPPFFNPFGELIRFYENPTWKQYPYLQIGYFGFYEQLKTNPLFGDSMIDEARSASLHLFGAKVAPSRTVVWGDVHQTIPRMGRLRFHCFGKTSNVSISAPSKSGYDGVPYLPYCPDADAYRADLATESAGGAPKHLANIRAFGPGAPGIDEPFQLDSAVYTHARMFGDSYTRVAPGGLAAGYSDFMTRIDRMPYAEIADAMQYPTFFPPHTGAMQSVLDQPYPAYRDVSGVELPFTDGLHRQLGQAQYFKGDLATFFTRPRPDDPSPAETILRARTLREFADQSEFFAYCRDLTDPNLLHLWEPVRILQGGLDLTGQRILGIGHIVVDAGNVVSGGLEALNLPDGLPSNVTIATLKGDIELAGGGRHDGYWMALDGTVKVTGHGDAFVRGGLAARAFSPASIGGGLRVTFTSHGDPTRTDDPQAARYTDYYQVAFGQVPIAVERLP